MDKEIEVSKVIPAGGINPRIQITLTRSKAEKLVTQLRIADGGNPAQDDLLTDLVRILYY